MVDQMFASKLQKIIFLILLVSVIGLMTGPLLPWVATTSETGEKVTVTRYASEGGIHVGAEVKNIEGDISMTNLSFWLAIVFGIVALVGLALYKNGGKLFTIGNIILLVGVILIVWGILAVVYNGLIFAHVGDLESAYFYNYIPLVMAIILLIGTIIYMAMVLRTSIRGLTVGRPTYPYVAPLAAPQYPPQQPPAPPKQYS